MAFRYELANNGHQIVGDFHHGLALRLKCGLVLRNGFVFSLFLVVSKDFAYSLLVPA